VAAHELGEGVEIAGARRGDEVGIALHPRNLTCANPPRLSRIKAGVGLIERVWSGSCEETEPLLSEFLEGELRGLRRGRVRRHLDRCQLCRALFGSLSRTVEHLRSLGRIDSPPSEPSVADAVLRRIRREGAWRGA